MGEHNLAGEPEEMVMGAVELADELGVIPHVVGICPWCGRRVVDASGAGISHTVSLWFHGQCYTDFLWETALQTQHNRDHLRVEFGHLFYRRVAEDGTVTWEPEERMED